MFAKVIKAAIGAAIIALFAFIFVRAAHAASVPGQPCLKPVPHKHHAKPAPQQSCTTQAAPLPAFLTEPVPEALPAPHVLTRYQRIPDAPIAYAAPPRVEEGPAPAPWFDSMVFTDFASGGNARFSYSYASSIVNALSISVDARSYITNTRYDSTQSFTNYLDNSITQTTIFNEPPNAPPPQHRRGRENSAPELNPGGAFGSLTLLLGSLAVLRGRRYGL